EWLNNLAGEKKPSNNFMRNINLRFPRTQVNEDVAREIAPRIFLEEKINQLTTIYGLEINTEYQDQVIKDAVPALLERRKDFFETLAEEDNGFKPSVLKEKTIDWRRFDSNESYFLESDELASFIITLLSHPQKMVFEHEILQTPEKDSDHPNFRTRILQIYKVFHPESYEAILSQILEETNSSQI
ncbi:MAG: hypothetical protein ACTSQ9_05115, partial [Candidatus Hodarchaeales archaeon]